MTRAQATWFLNWFRKTLVSTGRWDETPGFRVCGNEELPGVALAEGGGIGGAAVAVTYQSVAVRRANAANTASTISARENLGFMVREPTAAL